jgi:hypothetical protein
MYIASRRLLTNKRTRTHLPCGQFRPILTPSSNTNLGIPVKSEQHKKNEKPFTSTMSIYLNTMLKT